MRRAGGRLRFLPADLLGWPLLWVGLGLAAGVRGFADRAPDGLTTVRLVLPAPAGWLADPLAWAGLVLVGVGVVITLLATRLASPWRRLTVVRYGWFALAARLAVVAWLAASWRAFNHVVDAAPGGLQWRFLAQPRGGLANDLTAWVLLGVAVALVAASFGRVRAADLPPDPQEPRPQRTLVPAAVVAATDSSKARPSGVTAHTRSSRASSDDTGS